MNSIEYPIIILGKNAYSIRESEKEFKVCTTLALKKGTIKNIEFIDSNGIEYQVISGTVLFQLFLVDGTVLSRLHTRIKPTEMPNQSVTYTEFPSLRRTRIYFYRLSQPEIEALSTQLGQLKLETPPKKQRTGFLEDVKSLMKRRRQGGKRKTIRKLKRKSRQTRRR